jgi:hypothetical protein
LIADAVNEAADRNAEEQNSVGANEESDKEDGKQCASALNDDNVINID